MKKKNLKVGGLFLMLTLFGCGDGKEDPKNKINDLLGTFISKETIESRCYSANPNPQIVPQLTVSFSEKDVCIMNGCDDAISCVEITHLSLAEKLQIVGKDCHLKESIISCAGITLHKVLPLD